METSHRPTQSLIFYESALGLPNTKPRKPPAGARLLKDHSSKKKNLRRLPVKEGFLVVVPNLSHFGGDVSAILQAISKIAAAGGMVRTQEPNLSIGPRGKTYRLIQTLLDTQDRSTKRKKLLTELAATLLKGSPLGRPSKVTAQTVKEVKRLRAENFSYRRISRALEGRISVATVQRILRVAGE